MLEQLERSRPPCWMPASCAFALSSPLSGQRSRPPMLDACYQIPWACDPSKNSAPAVGGAWQLGGSCGMTVCASCGHRWGRAPGMSFRRPRPLAFADTMPFADMHEEELDWGADEEPGYELNCERARGRVVDLHRGWEWPLQAHEPPACGQEALTFAIFSAHLSSQNRCRRGRREPPQSTRRVAAGRSRQAIVLHRFQRAHSAFTAQKHPAGYIPDGACGRR